MGQHIASCLSPSMLLSLADVWLTFVKMKMKIALYWKMPPAAYVLTNVFIHIPPWSINWPRRLCFLSRSNNSPPPTLIMSHNNKLIGWEINCFESKTMNRYSTQRYFYCQKAKYLFMKFLKPQKVF